MDGAEVGADIGNSVGAVVGLTDGGIVGVVVDSPDGIVDGLAEARETVTEATEGLSVTCNFLIVPPELVEFELRKSLIYVGKSEFVRSRTI